MTGASRLGPGRRGFLGTDLTGSHPISFVVPGLDPATEAAERDIGLKPLAIITADPDIKLDAAGKMQCTTCHDPHTGVRHNDLEGALGITVACEECHSSARQSILDNALGAKKGDFACEDCHMPPLAKSAVAFSTFVGDIRTHLAKINTTPNAEQFDGGFANHYITLDFACLGCHTNEDRAWAASHADEIHGPGFAANRQPAPTFGPIGR